MLKINRGLARGPLCCAAVLMLVGCTMLTPEWHPRRVSASDCPDHQMQYCVINNYGKRCECASTQSVEAISRGRQ
jgi:hypothetical protein